MKGPDCQKKSVKLFGNLAEVAKNPTCTVMVLT